MFVISVLIGMLVLCGFRLIRDQLLAGDFTVNMRLLQVRSSKSIYPNSGANIGHAWATKEVLFDV